MQKGYKNRQLKTENSAEEKLQQFFFPKENPPVTVMATSLEEAVEKLKAVKNKKL